MTKHENSRSRQGGAMSLLNGQSLVKKMVCSRSKNVFCKKSGACLIAAKVQTHPSSYEIGRSLRKI
jgi:hypothetical protein